MPLFYCSKCRGFKEPHEQYIYGGGKRKGTTDPRCKDCIVDVVNHAKTTENSRAHIRRTSTNKRQIILSLLHNRIRATSKMFSYPVGRRKLIMMDMIVDSIDIPTHCPYLEMELDYTVRDNTIFHPNGVSIDRIDPTVRYQEGNVRVISMLANMMKTAATRDQLLMFAKNVMILHADEVV